MSTFTTSDGLRALLLRFADPSDPATWDGPEGTELIGYCVQRFARLARKYGQPVEDGAAFAFEAMRDPHLLVVNDLWAVVTTAVKRSIVAQFTGDALLCGDRAARHAVDVHDPKRISDRDWDFLADQLTSERLDDGGHSALRTSVGSVAPAEMRVAVTEAVRLFRAFGWPADAAEFALAYIAGRLEIAAHPATAFEYLRRDRVARARLDIDQRGWTRLLTVVLGSPDPDRRLSPRGRGLLLRLAAGCRIEELVTEPSVVLALSASAPQVTEASHA